MVNVYWPTYLINTLPFAPLNNNFPYEVLHQHKPLHSHLRSFGCLCYPTIHKTRRTKFESKSIPHVFVGYPFGTKDYKVLSLATKKIHISRDVTFHETIFVFAISKEITHFPSSLFHSITLRYHSMSANHNLPTSVQSYQGPVSEINQPLSPILLSPHPLTRINSSNSSLVNITHAFIPFNFVHPSSPALRKPHRTQKYLNIFLTMCM